jgi:hypothetical protein
VAQATWLLMLVSLFDRQSGHKRGQAGKRAAVTSGSNLMDEIDVDISKYINPPSSSTAPDDFESAAPEPLPALLAAPFTSTPNIPLDASPAHHRHHEL